MGSSKTGFCQGEGAGRQERIALLEAEIADLKRRFPAHSLKPAMFARLEELEEELARLQEEASLSDKPFAYTVTTDKSFAEAVAAVEAQCAEKNFRIQHVHDVQAVMASKGYEIEPLKIIEICNVKYAHQVLSKDILISLMMPCKINVYTVAGKTYISALRPTVLASFFPEADLDEVAAEVDRLICSIVDGAR